jgi:bacterial/archaeal transporter family-2 protein
MSSVWAGALALAAGAVLVAQGEMLASISQRHGIWLALLANSVVGLPVILALATQQNSSSFISILENARWWYLIPGLLGTFFVAANANAYAKLGPLAAASLIITAQLVTALLADWIGLTGVKHTISVARVLGVGLMLGGCFLALPKQISN